jgi:hypothetical protein
MDMDEGRGGIPADLLIVDAGGAHDERGAAEGREGFAEDAGGHDAGVVQGGSVDEDDIGVAGQVSVLEAVIEDDHIHRGVESFHPRAPQQAVFGGDGDGAGKGAGDHEEFIAGGGGIGEDAVVIGHDDDAAGPTSVPAGHDGGGMAQVAEQACKEDDEGRLPCSAHGHIAHADNGKRGMVHAFARVETAVPSGNDHSVERREQVAHEGKTTKRGRMVEGRGGWEE